MTEEERNKITLDTADALEELVKSKGWEYLKDYLLVRIKGMKNELTKIDLAKEITNASKTQGKIEALDSIFNRINNVLHEATLIRKNEEAK